MKIKIIILFLIFACLPLFHSCLSHEKINILPYPSGYNFAFTITDDPDDGWLEQKRTVYDFLDSIGLKISKGVWVFDNTTGSGESGYYYQGVSLENTDYLLYVQELKQKGFNLFLHTVTAGNDKREITIKGFETYKNYFGEYPAHWVNHWTNYDNIYWGYKRFNSRLLQWLYDLVKKEKYHGDESSSDYFWGDYCAKHIKYVRGFASDNLNTFSVNPSMPYHDPQKPYVKYWYDCSDGADRKRFNSLISKKNVDKLIQDRGTAIIYTHFAKGFIDKKTGKIDPETKNKLEYIASHKDGWFVPVRTILDRFIAIRDLKVMKYDDSFFIINTGENSVHDIVIEVYNTSDISWNNNKYKSKNGKPAIIILDKLAPSQTAILKTSPKTNSISLTLNERIHQVTNWLFSRY